MTKSKKGKTNAKAGKTAKKASKKTGGAKAPAKTAAPRAQAPKAEGKTVAVRKGDIVRAWNKNFLVETVSQKKRSLTGTHLTYVESRITTDLSRTISFDDIHTIWNMA